MSVTIQKVSLTDQIMSFLSISGARSLVTSVLFCILALGSPRFYSITVVSPPRASACYFSSSLALET